MTGPRLTLIPSALSWCSGRQFRTTHAQNALARLTAERESHQRAIIQNTDVGLLNLDDHFKPLFLNERARNLFKLGTEDTFRDPSELIQPWHPEEAGNGSWRAEGVSSDGNRFPILYTLNPIRSGEHNEFILTVQDVTELTAAQQALQEANKALERPYPGPGRGAGRVGAESETGGIGPDVGRHRP